MHLYIFVSRKKCQKKEERPQNDLNDKYLGSYDGFINGFIHCTTEKRH